MGRAPYLAHKYLNSAEVSGIAKTLAYKTMGRAPYLTYKYTRVDLSGSDKSNNLQ
jgi:hypothetical protein